MPATWRPVRRGRVFTDVLGWPAAFSRSSGGLQSAVCIAGFTRGNTYLPSCPLLPLQHAANVPEVITVAASNVANKYNGTKAGEQKGAA